MKRTEKVAVVSAVSYAALTGYLVITAALTQSRGVWAGAALVGIRLVSSLLLLAVLRLSERHSATFPSGLYKLQNLIATCFGAFIIVLAYELLKGNVWKLYVGHGTPHGGFAAFSSLLAVVVAAGFLSWYKARVGRQENCPALTADARNSFADFLAFSAVAASIFLEMSGIRHIHNVITLIIGVYLLYVGGRVLLDGLKVLLDASVDRKVLREVERIAEGHPLVESVVDVRGRSSGSYQFINLSILVITTDLRQATRVARELEREVREGVSNIDTVRVEFDVKPKDSLLCAVPAEVTGGEVSSRFAEVGSLEVFEIDIKGGSVVASERFANPVPREAAGRGVRLAVALARRGVDVLLSPGPLDDDDITGTLEAYDVEILSRPTVRTLAGAEDELLEFVAALGGVDEQADREGAR